MSFETSFNKDLARKLASSKDVEKALEQELTLYKKRALELNASAIILVHNHPSGDPTPSDADITMTHQIKDAAEVLGIVLHDHLIIGKSRELSFRSQGYL